MDGVENTEQEKNSQQLNLEQQVRMDLVKLFIGNGQYPLLDTNEELVTPLIQTLERYVMTGVIEQ